MNTFGNMEENLKEWDLIRNEYNLTKSIWNESVFGYLTFENFLRYYYNPPTQKKNEKI